MLDFIINPIAGGKKGKRMSKNLAIIKDYLTQKQVEYNLHFSTKRGDVKMLTKTLIEKGATDIVIVGGDGSLHEAINGFHSFDKVNLGIIPCGTGNDFASALGIPQNPVKALDLILDGTPKYTDYMQMPTVRGLNIIGMGIDVDVLKRYNALKRKTKFGYTMSLVKTLCKFDYVQFDATFNQQTTNYKSFIACIANGHRYGGGIPICPVANPTDNQLDFVAVKSMRKLKIIGAFLKLKAGKLLSLKEAVHYKTNFVKIHSPVPYTVNVDGELYDNIPFEVEIVPNTLKVYR